MADKLKLEEGWVPSQFLQNGPNAFIEMVYLGQRTLHESFMRFDLQRCRKRTLVDYRALNEYCDSTRDMSENVAGMIFHMSRCGSTLTTQMLRHSNEHVVVAEPDVLGQFLQSFKGETQEKTKPHETPAQFGFETEESASQRIKTIIVGVSKDLGYPNVTEQATLLRRGDYGITLYRELKESIPLRLEEAINRKVWSAMIDAYEETAGLKRKNLRPGLKPPNLEDDNFKLFLADLQPRLKAIFPKVTGIMLNRESGGIQGAATNRAARDVIIAKFLKGKI